MQVLLILAHPSPGSFNHAIADTAAGTARRLGHSVTVHDLYQEGFDPCLQAEELVKDAKLPAELERQVAEVCAADALIFVHPNYWSRPPAILCGWADRVLRTGRAYHFVPDGAGSAQPVGLLKARVGFVFNTANTPQEVEEAHFGDPLEVHWKRVVFGLCGVSHVCRRVFSPVIVSTPEQRAAWLREVEQAVESGLTAAA